MRKGQAAMEFLMTYGWAILVVLVAIGALAYFGVLSPEQFLPEKCTISTGSGLFCGDFAIDSSAAVRLNIKNILTESVTVTAITLTNGGGGTGTCTFSGSTAIAADATVPITLACSPVLSEKVKSEFSITFTKGGFAKSTTGALTGRVP